MADLQTLARRKAQKYGLDPNVFERQIRQESGFNPNAVSPAGAIGIAQIMPATARGWGVNPRDPNAALDAAARNMARYVKQYGGIKNALVAYNAGPGRVGGKLPAETQNYIKTILGGSSGGGGNGGGSGGSAVSGSPVTIPGQTVTTQVPTVDKAGFDQAQQRSLVGAMIARRNPNSFLLRSGLLSTAAPSLSDFTGSRTITDTIPGKTVINSASTIATPDNVDVAKVVERANILNAKHHPYKWGGGHQARVANVQSVGPVDCSGAVSAVLGINPRVSGQFTKWGKPGSGGNITVYANSEHVLMKIRGRDGKFHFFGTSHSNPGGGAGWIPQSAVSPGYLSRFTARHV
jgi:hypothetical protein